MIDRRGYNVVPEEQYYNEIMAEFKKEFPHMSDSPSNLLSIIARIIARNENARDYDRVTAYSDAYVATATGMHLSKAVRTAGISRLNGTRAVGKVTITKEDDSAQAIIPSGMQIKSGNNIYLTTNTNATIMNTPTLEMEIVSSDVGAVYNISSGSKFDTVLNIKGIKSILASTDISGGTDIESDLNLRERYFRRMNAYSNSSLKGVIDRVSAINDVYMVSGDENRLDTEQNGLLPHSLIIYVAGGTNKEIAEAIMHSKPAGIQTNGDITETVVVSGKEHEIKFSRFESQTVYYNLEVAIDKTISSPDFVDNIKKVIVDFTNATSKIVAYELSNHISQEIAEVRGVKTLKFGTSEDPQTSDDLSAPSGLNFTTDNEKIEITVI